MGYAVYQVGKRWGGYGIPAYCEHPLCDEEIDRGMAYACGGEPFSEVGCDRYFCGKHREYAGFRSDNTPCRHRADCKCDCWEVCERCAEGKSPFDYKQEHPKWINHFLKDKSWAKHRKENPDEVKKFKQMKKNL